MTVLTVFKPLALPLLVQQNTGRSADHHGFGGFGGFGG